MGTTRGMALSGRWVRPALRWLAGLALLVVLAGASITFALLVTPMQTVTVAGQVIQVGASAPDLSLSGPGQVDLFGQNLPTNLRFTGPVRPRLQLSQISINSELTTFVEGARHGDAKRVLGARLADGWKRYFTWETVITGAGALVLLGAVAGWRRLPRSATIRSPVWKSNTPAAEHAVTSPRLSPKAMSTLGSLPFSPRAATSARPWTKSAGWQTRVWVSSDSGPSKLTFARSQPSTLPASS